MIINQILELLNKKIKLIEKQLEFQNKQNESKPSIHFLQTIGLLEGRRNALVDFKEDLLKLLKDTNTEIY